MTIRTRNANPKNQSEIVALHKEMKEISMKVDRILRTLIGDEEMAQEGLVAKVSKHDDWIEKQKLVLAKIFGIAIGSGVFGGAIIQLIMKLL
jgi:hypothetical protein